MIRLQYLNALVSDGEAILQQHGTSLRGSLQVGHGHGLENARTRLERALVELAAGHVHRVLRRIMRLCLELLNVCAIHFRSDFNCQFD